MGHIFNFSTSAVKRQSTFQGILVLLSFNTSSITKSHRANRCYTDAFIVLDLNRSTEIQYPLFRHFFNFSSTTVKRQSTFQRILELLAFNSSNITKSHRANRWYTDTFIVHNLNRSTEIRFAFMGHIFNFSTSAVKRQSTFQRILVLLSFNTSNITKSTSGQQVLYRCFHCARLVSKYSFSVSTFQALLESQFHSCEEIVYYSMDY